MQPSRKLERVDGDDQAKVLALPQQGRSIRAIAIALKTPKSTVARALKVALHKAAA